MEPFDLIPVSAIVLTHNEAVNIPTCLRALSAVDEVVVVDSGSTDETLSLARTAHHKVRTLHHPFQDFGDQRNWALDHAQPRHPWVLFVDADEVCTPDLLEEIRMFIAKPGDHVGAYVAGRNYFLGGWLRYSTFYPSYQLRLLKLGHVRYRKEGHGQREITEGPLHYLHHHWNHDGFSHGVAEWIARHNRYSSDETELIQRLRDEPVNWRALLSRDPIQKRRAVKILAAKAPCRPLTRFLYTYVYKRGFLDGTPGLMYCLLRFAHEWHIIVKLEERRFLGRQP
jgi:glycosyltransferase involved in cell wall biosynthesis